MSDKVAEVMSQLHKLGDKADKCDRAIERAKELIDEGEELIACGNSHEKAEGYAIKSAAESILGILGEK